MFAVTVEANLRGPGGHARTLAPARRIVGLPAVASSPPGPAPRCGALTDLNPCPTHAGR